MAMLDDVQRQGAPPPATVAVQLLQYAPWRGSFAMTGDQR